MASVTLPPEARLAGGEPAFGSDMVLFRTGILGIANQLGIGGSGLDGALTGLTTEYWPQPTSLTLSGTHTGKHLSTLVATDSISIDGSLTIPASGNVVPKAVDDYYAGMPLPAWLQAGWGEGDDVTVVGEGGGGGSFGAGGKGDVAPDTYGGRGWGNNAIAANLFAASTLWRALRHLRGGFGGSGAGSAIPDPDVGYAGGCLILLCEGAITISGTITIDGGDGGTIRDIGAGGAGSLIIISSTEIDCSGATVNLRGGNDAVAAGSGGGGYFAAIAPTVTAPTTLNLTAGTATNPGEVGRDGSSHIETSFSADEIRAMVVASGLIGASAGAPGVILGLDE